MDARVVNTGKLEETINLSSNKPGSKILIAGRIAVF